MKTARVVAAIVIVLGWTVTALSQDRVLARAKISFPYSAHSQSLAAGTYEIRQVGAQTIRIQQPDSGVGVTLLSAQNIAAGDRVKLSFRRIGDLYFLAGVSSLSFHISLPKSRQELELAKTDAPSRTVEIVGRR